MKKIALIAALSAGLYSVNTLADVTATATATWTATATKDTTSTLVVTPLDSITFQYAEGMQRFNTQNGAFDVTIQGQGGATDFKLAAQVLSNTLTGSGASTLDVGVAWNGTALSSTAATDLVNHGNNLTSGLASLVSNNAYASADRTSAQGNFTFSIDSATSDGSTTTTFAQLNDGFWSGDVKVQFTATWTVDESSSSESSSVQVGA